MSLLLLFAGTSTPAVPPYDFRGQLRTALLDTRTRVTIVDTRLRGRVVDTTLRVDLA